jgi:hypothetical protein
MSPDPTLLLQIDGGIREDFESFRRFFFNGLLYATGAVFIGVVLEIPEAWHDIKRRVSLRFPDFDGAIYPTETVEGGEPRKRLAFAGLIILIFGLASEGIFETLVSKADGWERTFDGIALSAAEEHAAANEIEAESLRKQAEDEHIARVMLEERVAWRTIRPDDSACTTASAQPLAR